MLIDFDIPHFLPRTFMEKQLFYKLNGENFADVGTEFADKRHTLLEFVDISE